MTRTPYKIVLLLRRNPGLNETTFLRRWQDDNPMPPSPHLVSRTFNASAGHNTPIKNVAALAYDGVEELVFESRAQAEIWFADPVIRDWLEACTRLLTGAPQVISGTTFPIWAQSAERSQAVKIFTLPVRRAGMTMDAFAAHWIDHHAGLALAGPGTHERLLRLESTPADRSEWGGLAPADFDGIGVIMFSSPGSLAAEFASEHYRTVMAPDEPKFTNPAHSRALMMRECLVDFTSG